jgi:hypothetical protein
MYPVSTDIFSTLFKIHQYNEPNEHKSVQNSIPAA